MAFRRLSRNITLRWKKGLRQVPGGTCWGRQGKHRINLRTAKQDWRAIVVANRFTISLVLSQTFYWDLWNRSVRIAFVSQQIEVVDFTSSSLNRSMKFGIYLPPGIREAVRIITPFSTFSWATICRWRDDNSWVKAALDAYILTVRCRDDYCDTGWV